MGENRLSVDDAKRIPITDYLSGLGIEPARISGVDYWYHSPLRQERTPSFKVNTKLNVWFDHGTGEGGGILTLGMKLHKCSLPEFLDKLSEGRSSPIVTNQQNVVTRPERKLEIISVDKLSSEHLIEYLNSRRIDEVLAGKYCSEIEFRIDGKTHRAIGFPNRSGGYELRNSWFKGSSSPKDISLIDKESDRLAVFEGFIDFLSALKINDRRMDECVNDSDYLVLNSVQLVKRALPVLQCYPEVNLLLDNDFAATKAKQIIEEKGIPFQDVSHLYQAYKDLNEYLMADAPVKWNQKKGLRLRR